MFVQSKVGTDVRQRNGVAIRQRCGDRETLVQWENGQQRWIDTIDLSGTVRLIGSDVEESYDEG
jgi:hypothetical protein